MSDNKSNVLELQKQVKGSSRDSFAAFTDPSKLSTWFSTNCKVDLRVGGKYTNDDKDHGEYLEIREPEYLKFSWDNADHCPGTIVEVEFDGSPQEQTTITLRHSGFNSSEQVKEMNEGWSWALESLVSYMETGNPILYEDWKKQQN